MNVKMQINRSISEKKRELETLAASSRTIAEERAAFVQTANEKIAEMNQNLAANEERAHEIKGAIEALEALRK